MAILMKKYEATSNLTNLGTVGDLAGKGGTISLIPKNFKDLTKRVCLIVSNKKKESVRISCSKRTSDALRNKTLKMSQLIQLSIVKNEEGVYFISSGESSLISLDVDKIDVNNLEHVVSNKALSDAEIADLIAF